MTFLYSQVQHADAQFDRLLLSRTVRTPVDSDGRSIKSPGSPASTESRASSVSRQSSFSNIVSHRGSKLTSHEGGSSQLASPQLSGRSSKLLSLISSLSISQTKQKSLSLSHIRDMLSDPVVFQKCAVCQLYLRRNDPVGEELVSDQEYNALSDSDWLEHTLEWILLAKTTISVYWVLLNTVLNDTMTIVDHLSYYDDLIPNDQYLTLYGLQMSPVRMIEFCQKVYKQVLQKLAKKPSVLGQPHKPDSDSPAGAAVHPPSRTQGWANLYKIVRSTVHSNSVRNVSLALLRPLVVTRTEVMKRRQTVEQLRNVTASALGYLSSEGFVQNYLGDLPIAPAPSQGAVASAKQMALEDSDWKSSVAYMISVMDNVLVNLQNPPEDISMMSVAIQTSVDEDPLSQRSCEECPPSKVKIEIQKVSFLLPVDGQERLATICDSRFLEYRQFNQGVIRTAGRPPVWVRYWIPAVIGLMSSGTILQILTSRKADIVTWIQDTGRVSLAFWRNWVIEPVRKIIQTIRHDDTSSISIASRRSLQGDSESLERMVVEFVVDESRRNGVDVNSLDLASIKAKVHEGDVTPVLMAYENDLRHPFWGTVRGMLVRSLLIQVQKTKVDVALAISGIDNLLQSQELVFGFVSLTPGLLACFGLMKWASGVWQNRSGLRSWRRKDELMKELRNIDRTLWKSGAENGMLVCMDHGLILCQVHRLREIAEETLPRTVAHDFVQELDEIVNVKAGLDRHKAAVNRLQWSFSRWLQ